MKLQLSLVATIFFFCFIKTLSAQNAYFEIPNNGQCSNSTGTYLAVAQIGLNVPLADNYIWTVTGANCTPTFAAIPGTSVAPWGNITNTAISIYLPCCSLFTVTCIAMIGTSSTTVNQSSFFSNGFTTGVIHCIAPATLSPSVLNICSGASATLNASGAVSYSWSNGSVTSTGSLVVSPTVNTTYSLIATSPNGCITTATNNANINVQAISSLITPASQSICAGNPVCFTAAAVASGSSNTTAITSYEWFAPGSPFPFASSAVTCTTAPFSGGNFFCRITHTGSAGTCTVGGVSSVVITTNIPVFIAPSALSICPNTSVTLTAASIQTTTTSNFTWTVNDGTTTTISSSHANPFQLTSGTDFPLTVTVNVDYFGCPGTASAVLSKAFLTPTLISSSLLSCPGQPLTLSATGGITYTFTELASNSMTTTTLSPPGSVSPSMTTTPSVSSFPVQYCVTVDSVGCGGTACLIVNKKNIYPILIASSTSVCAGTDFTLTALGSGLGSNTTFSFSSDFNGNLGNSNPLIYTWPLTPSSNHTYSVTVDSAGCTGKAQLVLYRANFNVQLSSATATIFSGQSVTLVATGGANTSYTFFASVPQFTASSTATIINTGNNYSVTHTPVSSLNLATYTVQADSAGCVRTSTCSVTIMDSEITSIQASSLMNSIYRIYPNPTRDKLSFDNKFPVRVQLYNSQGKILVEKEVAEGVEMLDLSDFKAGIYHLKIIENSKIQILKIVKTD